MKLQARLGSPTSSTPVQSTPVALESAASSTTSRRNLERPLSTRSSVVAEPTNLRAREVGGRRAASPTGAVWAQHGLARLALTDAPKLNRAVAANLDRLVDATPAWRDVLRRGFAAGELRVVAERDQSDLGSAKLLTNGLLVDFAASRILGRVVDAQGAQQALAPEMQMVWSWFKSSQDGYVDEDYVDELSDRYKKGDPWLEPAEVKTDGTIKDGHHRLAAQEKSGSSPDFVVVDDDDKVVGQSTGETENGKPWWSPF